MIRILTVSDRYSHFEKAVSEYESRLSRTVEIVAVRPEKLTDPETIIRKETDRLIEHLERAKAPAFLLDELGNSYTTLALAGFVRKTLDTLWGDVTLVVGGAFGVDRERILPHIRGTLRLSDCTLPHTLALLVLLEQLYRIHEIWKGSGYHHA